MNKIFNIYYEKLHIVIYNFLYYNWNFICINVSFNINDNTDNYWYYLGINGNENLKDNFLMIKKLFGKRYINTNKILKGRSGYLVGMKWWVKLVDWSNLYQSKNTL